MNTENDLSKQSCDTEVKTNVCPVCSECCKDRNRLEIHIRKKHVGYKLYVCQICSRGFNAYYNLVRHNKLHKKGLDHSCHKCRKVFKEKVDLEAHLASHRGNN